MSLRKEKASLTLFRFSAKREERVGGGSLLLLLTGIYIVVSNQTGAATLSIIYAGDSTEALAVVLACHPVI